MILQFRTLTIMLWGPLLVLGECQFLANVIIRQSWFDDGLVTVSVCLCDHIYIYVCVYICMYVSVGVLNARSILFIPVLVLFKHIF